ncbi:unnamed protein product [Effrenium voratum]|uniref:Uncharacterized protein n=1 Tax=Effrenium voratum TaxID=2562239 RepID=A0AA36ID40_9DINO|nr:unnamed protein product [Effrenium voratum]
MAHEAASPSIKQELCRLRAGLTDSQARHRDTALLLERLSGQNAALRAQLRDSEASEISERERGVEKLRRETPRRCPTPSTPSSGRSGTAVEANALRHRVWQLERSLEEEKRRSAWRSKIGENEMKPDIGGYGS